MSQHDDSGPLMFFGGVVAVIAIGSVALKVISALFEQLAVTFDAFGKMVSSFFPMLLNVLAMVSLVAGIVLVAVSGVYFSWKYIRMVKRATELQRYVNEQLDTRLEHLRTDLEASFNDRLDSFSIGIASLESKVAELMKPATASPPMTKKTASPADTNCEPPSDTTEDDPAQTRENDSEIDSSAPIEASQPY